MKPIEFFIEYSTVVGWVFAGVFLFFMLYMKSKFVTREEHDKLKFAFDEAVKKIDKVETIVAQLPTAQAVQSLIVQMTKLEGELLSVSVRFEGLDDVVKLMQKQADRIEEYLKHRIS